MRTALKRIGIVLLWALILIAALILLVILVMPAFLVGVFSKFFRRKVGAGMDDFASDLKGLNIAIDILGNVTIFNWLWFLFKTKEGYKFGSYRETISYVLKINHDAGSLKFLGLPLYNFINFVDKGHFDKLSGGIL